MSTLRTLLVEDESPARKRLRRLLEAHRDTIHVVGEADQPQQAIERIETLRPDLLFLDIEMPGMNGFELLKRIQHRPLVIFVTAYAEYAVKAFEENALDYLLKPVEPERLAAALERIGQRRSQPLALSPDHLDALARHLRPQREATSLPVKVGDRFLFIALDTISFFEARDKYVFVHTTQGKEYLTDDTLTALVAKLPPHFIQVHRAYIVNRTQIRAVQPFFNNRFVLHVGEHPGVKLRTGPSFAQVVRDTLLF